MLSSPPSRALVAAALLGLASARGSASDWPCTWATFPANTPSQSWPDGPIVGNGNMGIAVGGAPGLVSLFGTVNGFWGVSLGQNSTMPPLSRGGGGEGAGEGAGAGAGFDQCPSANCSITVGLTLLRVLVSSPQLAGSWTAQLDIARAAATVTLAGAGGAALQVTLYVSATSQVAVMELKNTGGVALSSLNLTAAVNENVQHVPTSAGCLDASGAPAACAAPPAPAGVLLTKDANSAAAHSAFPITAAAALWPVAADAGVAATANAPFEAFEKQNSWVAGEVETRTVGVTTLLSLPAGAAATYAISMAASEDPGVKPAAPAAVVGARVAAVTPQDLAPLRAAHELWWAAFFAASAVSLEGEPETEGFWWSSLYALGSGSRAGQTVMDLWSPFRTTDYSLWRSNPTMDYNQQALYSGAVAANHAELLQPYFDFLSQALASGSPQLESAALGCPGGIHLSVDLAPFGLKLGVYGAPQAWGIRSNAVYAAVLHSYYWAAADRSDPAVEQFARDQIDFLAGVAAFWKCYLTKAAVPYAPDGYRFWSVGDCDGDEGCDAHLSPQETTNPTWTVTYLTRLLETLPSVAAAAGRAADPAWADMLAHLPPTPTTVHNGVPVLSAYGEGAANASATQATSFLRQSGYLHALWPGETLSPMSEPNATLVAAALNTFNWTQWNQGNSFSWVYAAAARAGVPPDTTLGLWRKELRGQLKTNRLVAFSGLCSDSLGAVAFVHDMLVHSQEGFLRLFPAWPANQSAAFSQLRMRGALLVSAAYAGRPAWAGLVAGRTGGTANATILALAGGAPVALLSPWPDAPTSAVTVVDRTAGNAPVALRWSSVAGRFGGPLMTFDSARGHVYVVTATAAGA
jgi:hypothetical protein